MFNKIKRYLKSPYYALGDDLIKRHPEWMSDKYFIRVFWKQMMGYPLDLKHPKTFNEKLQWMKLFDRNPLYTELVDKIKVKHWVAERIGYEHIVPTLAIYDDIDVINLDALPNQFVLKCNHDSGGVVICRDKSTFNLDEAKAVLKKRLEHNFYWDYREWPYKHVERRVFAEQFLHDDDNTDLPDYKVFTFDGVPKLIQVDFDRFSAHKRNLYDTDWNFLDAEILYPSQREHVFPRPDSFEELLALAGKLGEGFREVRVDFYVVKGHVYFGEMTFFHGAGTERFSPPELGVRMGEWIDLSI